MNKGRFHHIVDITNGNQNISDKKIINEFVVEMAKVLDMKILTGPITVDGVDINPGITSFCIVDFSHISIHTFTNDNEVFIDIFSCKTYDENQVISTAQKYFTTPQSEIRHKQVWWGE